MSETETNPMIETPPPAVVERRRREIPVWPFVFLVGFLALAAGEGYLWHVQQAATGQATQLAVLQAQVADLRVQAAKPPPANDNVVVQADLAVKVATLAAQLNAVQAQMAADHGALTNLQANSADLTKLTARMNLMNQLETARMALAAGQKLGSIPNAPLALAQFATMAPPTEAQLRLSFPEAARAAEAASISGDAKDGRWSRALARLESLVTVSEGPHVIIGAPAAGVIGQAQTLLDAGDLAGAVTQLDTLSLPTQQAMGGWLAQAKSLLAARAALIVMASQG